MLDRITPFGPPVEPPVVISVTMSDGLMSISAHFAGIAPQNASNGADDIDVASELRVDEQPIRAECLHVPRAFVRGGAGVERQPDERRAVNADLHGKKRRMVRNPARDLRPGRQFSGHQSPRNPTALILDVAIGRDLAFIDDGDRVRPRIGLLVEEIKQTHVSPLRLAYSGYPRHR
jgi:hypothetical protein